MGSIGEIEVCLPVPVFVAAVKLTQEQSVDYIGADKHGDYKYGLHITRSNKIVSMKVSLLRSGDSDGHFKIQIGDVMRVVAPSSDQSHSNSPHLEAVSSPEKYIEVSKERRSSPDKDVECLGTTFAPNPRRSLAPEYTGTRKRKLMGRFIGSLTSAPPNKVNLLSSALRRDSQQNVSGELQQRQSSGMVNGGVQPSLDHLTPSSPPSRQRSTSHSSEDINNSSQTDLRITDVRTDSANINFTTPNAPTNNAYHSQNSMPQAQAIYEAGEYFSLMNSRISPSVTSLNASMQSEGASDTPQQTDPQGQVYIPVTLKNDGQGQGYEGVHIEASDSAATFTSSNVLSSVTTYENKSMPFDNRSLAKKVKRKYVSCRFCPICNTPQRNLHTHLERVHHLNRDARQEWLQREKMARLERRNNLVRRMTLPHVPVSSELPQSDQTVNEEG
ncbi:uncharacterized protein LOC106159457 [Lingula anatina]|uniref:Uncharacterized protein LOC106159457 n=1 Tax=Lingula anatina TaxID=7574 RepID=A0A1S3HYU7_LINAN|nr:uncharacterized protein LOC106159457 [Lingula anatina]|eukprot:XP_013391197.1 uncharacterized protein LOC106159457 [Lingula anatina]